MSGSTRSAVALGALGALVLAACQAGPAASDGPGPTGGSSPVGSGEASIGPDESGPDFPPGFVVGEGEFLLGNPTVGLVDLASYRATLTASFVGTVTGSSANWSSTTSIAATNGPRSAVRTVEVTGAREPTEPVWGADIGDIAYRLAEDGSCAARAIAEDGEAALDEPAAALSGVFGGLAAGVETINGLEANVFTFDRAALGLSDNITATGKAWISTTSELLVRYELTIDGGPSYFGETIEGTLTTRYELTQLDGPVALDIPIGCVAGPVDAPTPAGATVTSDEAGVLSLTTAQPVREVAAFYEDAAAGAGWTIAQAPAIGDDAALLKFTAPGLAITIVARTGDNGTIVTILTSRR